MQIRFLDAIRRSNLPITGIIFITDTLNKEKLSPILSSAMDNVEILSFESTPTTNDYGLRVNISQFKEAEKFKKIIKKYPNHLVLISTPYSCPNLTSFITNEDTIANRSSLFFFENKKIYSKKFNKELNFIEEFGKSDFNKLANFFNTNNEDLYFLKPLGEYTGGTTVIPLNTDAFKMNSEYIRSLLNDNNYYLYKQINALNITSSKGEHFGTQFRAFIDNTGEFNGFIIKFSEEAIHQTQKRTSLKQLNKLFNSSSGTGISIIFERKDSIKPVSLSFSKNERLEDLDSINKYLDTIKLGDLSLTRQSDLEKIMKILYPKAREIRNFFNNFFFVQSWHELYKKFYIDKTYME